jgi:hypothetical protein
MIRSIVAGFTLCLLIACITLTGCDNSKKEVIATVVSAQGDVKLRPHKDNEFIEAKTGASIHNSGILKTGDESFATVKLLNKGIINFKSDVTFTFESTSEADVLQNSGTAIYKIDKNGKGFKAKTPQGVCCVLGTVFSIAVKEEALELRVKEGIVEFTTNSGETNKVMADQMLSILPGQKTDLSCVSIHCSISRSIFGRHEAPCL